MIIVDETIPVGDIPPPFPARDVVVKKDAHIKDFYDLKKEIGRGRFGTVYLCTCKSSGLNFAAKCVNTKRKQDRKNVEREIEIMKLLNDKIAQQKLIQLYDAFDMQNEICLVLEIVSGGELFERVTEDDFELTERACAIFVKQICEAIEYVHSKNILHLDMKPENILCLSREGNRVKLCDFGLARKYDPRKKLQVLFGTPEFVAPEVVNFEPISFGTDMWSIGVITYVLLSGLSPFMGQHYVETMTNVTHNKYDFDDEAFDEVSDESKDFIEKLLCLDKSDRLTPLQCYRHPWLKNLEKLTKYNGTTKLTKANSVDDIRCFSNSEMETLSGSSTSEMIIDAKLNFPFKSYDLKSSVNKNYELNNDSGKVVELSDPSNDAVSDKSIFENLNEELCNLDHDNKKRKPQSIEEFQLYRDILHLNSDSEATAKSKIRKISRDESALNQNVEKKNIECHSPENKSPIFYELEKCKENLKENVDRWHSNSNTQQVIMKPNSDDQSNVAFQIGGEVYYEDRNVKLETNSCVHKSENVNYTTTENLSQDKSVIEISKNNLAKELEKRLIDLQRTGESKLLEVESAPVPNLHSPNTYDFIDSSPTYQSNKENFNEANTNVKFKPSRDALPPNKLDDNFREKQFPPTPAGKVSRKSSKEKQEKPPSRALSRKTSKEKQDKPPSRESERTTPSKIRRRPSRDVPISTIHNQKVSSKIQESAVSNQPVSLWPDMICLNRDELDSSDPSEPESECKPITGKLELPLNANSSKIITSNESNKQSTCNHNETTNRSDSRTITWKLDLNAANIPHSQRSPIKKTFSEKRKENENSKVTKNKSCPEKKILSVCSDTESENFSGTSSGSSFENLYVQTPWGLMRRSSNPNLKDNTTIININDCLINVTKSVGILSKENKESFTKIDAIPVNPSKDLSKINSQTEMEKVSDELKSENKNHSKVMSSPYDYSTLNFSPFTAKNVCSYKDSQIKSSESAITASKFTKNLNSSKIPQECVNKIAIADGNSNKRLMETGNKISSTISNKLSIESSNKTQIESRSKTPIDSRNERTNGFRNEIPNELTNKIPDKSKNKVTVQFNNKAQTCNKTSIESRNKIPIEGRTKTPIVSNSEIPIELKNKTLNKYTNETPLECSLDNSSVSSIKTNELSNKTPQVSSSKTGMYEKCDKNVFEAASKSDIKRTASKSSTDEANAKTGIDVMNNVPCQDSNCEMNKFLISKAISIKDKTCNQSNKSENESCSLENFTKHSKSKNSNELVNLENYGEPSHLENSQNINFASFNVPLSKTSKTPSSKPDSEKFSSKKTLAMVKNLDSKQNGKPTYVVEDITSYKSSKMFIDDNEKIKKETKRESKSKEKDVAENSSVQNIQVPTNLPDDTVENCLLNDAAKNFLLKAGSAKSVKTILPTVDVNTNSTQSQNKTKFTPTNICDDQSSKISNVKSKSINDVPSNSKKKVIDYNFSERFNGKDSKTKFEATQQALPTKTAKNCLFPKELKNTKHQNSKETPKNTEHISSSLSNSKSFINLSNLNSIITSKFNNKDNSNIKPFGVSTKPVLSNWSKIKSFTLKSSLTDPNDLKTNKKPLPVKTPLLFSAKERISHFENQNNDKSQKLIIRTKTKNISADPDEKNIVPENNTKIHRPWSLFESKKHTQE